MEARRARERRVAVARTAVGDSAASRPFAEAVMLSHSFVSSVVEITYS